MKLTLFRINSTTLMSIRRSYCHVHTPCVEYVCRTLRPLLELETQQATAFGVPFAASSFNCLVEASWPFLLPFWSTNCWISWPVSAVRWCPNVPVTPPKSFFSVNPVISSFAASVREESTAILSTTMELPASTPYVHTRQLQ